MNITRYTRIWNDYLTPNPDFNYLMGYELKTWPDGGDVGHFMVQYCNYIAKDSSVPNSQVAIFRLFNRFLQDNWPDVINAKNLISKIAITVALDSFLDHISNHDMGFEDRVHQAIKVTSARLKPEGLCTLQNALATINFEGCWAGIALADLDACTTLLDAKIYIFMGKVESEPFLLTDISSWKQAIEKVYNIWRVI